MNALDSGFFDEFEKLAMAIKMPSHMKGTAPPRSSGGGRKRAKRGRSKPGGGGMGGRGRAILAGVGGFAAGALAKHLYNKSQEKDAYFQDADFYFDGESAVEKIAALNRLQRMGVKVKQALRGKAMSLGEGARSAVSRVARLYKDNQKKLKSELGFSRRNEPLNIPSGFTPLDKGKLSGSERSTLAYMASRYSPEYTRARYGPEHPRYIINRSTQGFFADPETGLDRDAIEEAARRRGTYPQR